MYKTIIEVNEFLNSRKKLGIKPGLSRMEAMLAYTDHPEKELKAIHIAGTNGKGSTLTFVKQVLMESGYTVGTFTSPHIDRNTHIQMNNQPIRDEEIIDRMNQLMPIIDRLDEENNPPTEFEIIVMLAILHFKCTVDIAIFEAGMGGKEDSTNCISPIVSIITTIGFDHTSFLGNSYKEIAVHKAGIIKKGVPVIVGDMNPEALSVIQSEAIRQQAPLHILSYDYFIENPHLDDRNREVFYFKHGVENIKLVLSMKGLHQVHNATLAAMALVVLKNKKQIKVNNNQIQTGIYHAVVHGRFEDVSKHPRIILDGAHNAEGVASFVEAVNRYYPTKRKQVLFAAFKDKPVKKMVQELREAFKQVTLTTFEHERAATSNDLVQLIPESQAKVEKDWKQLIIDFLHKGEKDEILFITGSLHFIQVARDFITHKSN